MSLTPEQISTEIRRLARRIEEKADELPSFFQKAAEADVAYRVQFAECLLLSDKKTVDQQKADAEIQCKRLLLERKTSEAVADAARESLRALRDQLSAVQSVGAMVRSELELSHIPTHPQGWAS